MGVTMILNENVLADTESNQYVDIFTPELGYALWRDNEAGNLDENGNPVHYYLQMHVLKRNSNAYVPHIKAKLIDETMGVFGKIPGMEEVVTYGLRNPEPSHTYIDENGVEQRKKCVY
jgi:hypothetical protein